MLVGCPKCKKKYRIAVNEPWTSSCKGKAVRCGKCGCLFRVTEKPGMPLGPKPSAVAPGGRIKVLVANESPAFCRTVEKVLATEPFDVFTYNDGKSALEAVEQKMPHILLLDVALPVMYGFQVCEAVRKNPATASVKIILIAAIYDRTRYKRDPISLYGADDYIEKHHIPDALAGKIYRLVYGNENADPEEQEAQTGLQELSPTEMAELQSTRTSMKKDEQQETAAVASSAESDAHVKARRLARLIVSDIALYNEQLVEEGVTNGTFYDLLAEHIREGQALYQNRIPEEIRLQTSYLDEAFNDFITQKKRELKVRNEAGVCGG